MEIVFVVLYLMVHKLDNFLVGGIPTPLKNMKVRWDDDIPNIWNNKSHD